MEQAPSPNPHSGGSDPIDPPIEALERELTRARAELAEYQALIDELPGIYESKFRHQVHGLAQDIRRLLDERRALQGQLDAALPPLMDRPALPPAVLEPLEPPAPDVAEAAPRSTRPASLRMRRWRRRVGRSWQQWQQGAVGRARTLGVSLPEGARLPLVAVASALGVAALVVAVDGVRRPLVPPESGGRLVAPSVPTTPPPVLPRRQDQDLLLRARGECWLEVQTLTGEVVYVATLQEGEQQRIRLRDGLRIRAGRPDLLDVAVGDGPFQVLNPIGDLGWRTFLPEVLPSEPGVVPPP